MAKTPKTKVSGKKAVAAEVARPGRGGHDDRIKAAARARWEGDPLMTINQVAIEANVGYATIQRWKRQDEWKKKSDMVNNASTAIKKIDAEITEGLANADLPDNAENRQLTAGQVARKELTKKQKNLLERHEKEWNGPRKVLYDALKSLNEKAEDRDVFSKLKIAKISTEALRNIQDGERKAYGIDKPLPTDDDSNIILIREKKGNTYEIGEE